MEIAEAVTGAFWERFGQGPSYVVRAPGRVNLIGEHTDYNDGFVLPMAIDRAVWIALRPRQGREVQAFSLDFDNVAQFSLDSLQRGNEGWAEYVKGVAWALREDGYRLQGWEGVVGGDVPVGAGLSSSAALEMAAARAFMTVGADEWEAARMARLAQRAENEWVGVSCGIMDQMISAAGEEGHALLIDTRSLETLQVPLPLQTEVVVLDTSTRRGLVDSAYNERRAQCEEAARFFDVPALRDIDGEALAKASEEMDPLVRRRARHVVSENARVLEAVRAMKAGDARRVGQLMNASHDSLRDDFEVSSPALDAMVACAQGTAGCFGARMTGAGFGGCAVALVERSARETFVERVRGCYQEATGLEPAVYVCHAAEGASVESAPKAER